MNTNNMQQKEKDAWRAVLRTLIEDRHTRQQVANVLGVNPVTLRRWANNESSPHPRMLQRLLSFFPAQDRSLAPLFTREFSPLELLPEPRPQHSNTIPSVLYRQVLALRASLSSPQDVWHLRELIIRHALDQFDHGRHDTIAMLALCTTPAGANRVRSLREVICLGYPPVGSLLDLKPYFGAESLIGYTISNGHTSIVHDTYQETRLPLPVRREHRSILVFPLRQGEQLAGTFTLASCTPCAFLSSFQLGEDFASLLSVICTKDAFYAPQEIDLAMMPTPSIQELYLFRFLRYLKHVYQNRQNTDHPLTFIEAEQIVWQQIEAELIQQASS